MQDVATTVAKGTPLVNKASMPPNEEDRPGIGDNLPPEDADPLRDRLHEDHADLLARRDALLGAIERTPGEVNDDEASGKMGDFSDQIHKCIKWAEATHKDEKAPFLANGRTVDSFLHGVVDPLKKLRTIVDARNKAFHDAKAARERAERQEAERIAQEEAARAAKAAAEAAAAIKKEDDLAAAIEAEDLAKQAAATALKAKQAAEAKPAELSRTRGEYGSVKSLKQFWNFADLNRSALDLGALRDHLPADALEKAVRFWIKANVDALRQGATLNGVRIFEDTRL